QVLTKTRAPTRTLSSSTARLSGVTLLRCDRIHGPLGCGEIAGQALTFGDSLSGFVAVSGLLQHPSQQQIANIRGLNFHGLGVCLNGSSGISRQLRDNAQRE